MSTAHEHNAEAISVAIVASAPSLPEDTSLPRTSPPPRGHVTAEDITAAERRDLPAV